jgi:hypothetical protein
MLIFCYTKHKIDLKIDRFVLIYLNFHGSAKIMIPRAFYKGKKSKKVEARK